MPTNDGVKHLDDVADAGSDILKNADEVGVIAKNADEIGAAAKGVGNPTLANKGNSIGRTVATNLNEKLAMQQVISNPLAGAQKLPFELTDARWLGN